jgi:hypothetical protein
VIQETDASARTNTGEHLDERGMRRQTLYLPPDVYEQIRATVFRSKSFFGKPSTLPLRIAA